MMESYNLWHIQADLFQVQKNLQHTVLEALAMVWAVQHFRAYLYGHNVMVITDHSAVKSVLVTTSSNGKHARWHRASKNCLSTRS